jgi:hypothetical protein
VGMAQYPIAPMYIHILHTLFVVQDIIIHERQVAMKLIIQVLELGPV